jgi:hypothetical protein
MELSMSTKMEAYHRVCVLAGAVVLEAPRGDKPTAYISRSALNRLEAALIEAGFDMRSARAKLDADKRAERKASRSKRDADTLAKFPVGKWVKVPLYGLRATLPANVAALDIGQVIEPDAASRPRKGKPDQVYVRWNVPGEPRGWISVYSLEDVVT